MKWFKEIRQCGTPAQAFFLNDQLVRWVQSFGHPRRHFLHVSGIAENLPISIASMKVGANWADTVASSKASSQFPDKIIWCEYGRTNSQLSELESSLNVAATAATSQCWVSCQISEKVLREHLNFGLSDFHISDWLVWGSQFLVSGFIPSFK